jgi:hypothetical protein
MDVLALIFGVFLNFAAALTLWEWVEASFGPSGTSPFKKLRK